MLRALIIGIMAVAVWEDGGPKSGAASLYLLKCDERPIVHHLSGNLSRRGASARKPPSGEFDGGALGVRSSGAFIAKQHRQ